MPDRPSNHGRGIRPVRMLAAALFPLLMAAAPRPSAPATLVLDCYVVQSGDLGLGQFVRHLEINPERNVVSIADAVRGGPPRFVGNGRLLSLEPDRVVYDFASSGSSGRTEIDRRSGAFTYNDGRSVVRGTCQPSAL